MGRAKTRGGFAVQCSTRASCHSMTSFLPLKKKKKVLGPLNKIISSVALVFREDWVFRESWSAETCRLMCSTRGLHAIRFGCGPTLGL